MTATPNSAPVLLLAEDDPSLQMVLEASLSDGGFEVVLASSGIEAIAELDADAARFSGLITDIRLGAGPDGWDVGRKARKVVSGMPVVYMSGNSTHEWSSSGVPGSVILQKPFALAQLVTAITTLLNQSSSLAALSDTLVNDRSRSI